MAATSTDDDADEHRTDHKKARAFLGGDGGTNITFDVHMRHGNGSSTAAKL